MAEHVLRIEIIITLEDLDEARLLALGGQWARNVGNDAPILTLDAAANEFAWRAWHAIDREVGGEQHIEDINGTLTSVGDDEQERLDPRTSDEIDSW